MSEQLREMSDEVQRLLQKIELSDEIVQKPRQSNI